MKAAVPAAITQSRTMTAISPCATERPGPARIKTMQTDITAIRARTTLIPRAASHRVSRPPPRLPKSAARNVAAVKYAVVAGSSSRSFFRYVGTQLLRKCQQILIEIEDHHQDPEPLQSHDFA